ncbi:MAG: 30S ribosomal protein S18 [Clostridia bacterium]|nr:30S ribosomal protein S18 [Clostridia bacterium]
MDEKRPQKKNYKKPYRKRVCVFCQEKITEIDYKDTAHLKRFIGDNGKMLSRRFTGACAKHQREAAKAIKRARIACILPYKID